MAETDKAVMVFEGKYKISILLDLLYAKYNPDENGGRSYLISGDIRKNYSNNNRIAEKLNELEAAGLITQEKMKGDHNKNRIELTPLGFEIARLFELIESYLICPEDIHNATLEETLGLPPYPKKMKYHHFLSLTRAIAKEPERYEEIINEGRKEELEFASWVVKEYKKLKDEQKEKKDS